MFKKNFILLQEKKLELMNRTPVTNGFEKNGLKFSSEEIDFVPKFSDANEF